VTLRSMPMRPAIAAVGGAMLIVAGLLLGLWWAGVLAGLALGWWLRGREVAATAAVAGLLGWGLPLLADAMVGQPVGRTAHVLGVIIGVPSAAVGVGVTLLVSMLFCLVGAWFSSALRGLAGGAAPRVKG
jgi:hypothetical protein